MSALIHLLFEQSTINRSRAIRLNGSQILNVIIAEVDSKQIVYVTIINLLERMTLLTLSLLGHYWALFS